MPQPPISRAKAEETINGLVKALQAGHPRSQAIMLVARKLKVNAEEEPSRVLLLARAVVCYHFRIR